MICILSHLELIDKLVHEGKKWVQLKTRYLKSCFSLRLYNFEIISHLELIDELVHEEKVGAAEDKILKIMFFSVMISN